LVALISETHLSGDQDRILWKINSSELYDVQSLCAVVNFRGFQKLYIPPRVRVFLWLLSHHKLLTRDNLNKRQSLTNVECLFCAEKETIFHMFSECAVTKHCLNEIPDFFNCDMGVKFEQQAGKFFSNKKFFVINIFWLLSWTGYLDGWKRGPGWSSRLEHKENEAIRVLFLHYGTQLYICC
jgi:hypothetical protein